eukprot:jgi/Picre1/31265/NNA_006619.t1
MRSYSRSKRSNGLRVGFVPTMGYLHEGHLSLLRAARESCDIVIASIYVNPTQFSVQEDFSIYPKNIEEDIAKLNSVSCDALFLPSTLYVSTEDDSMVVGADEVGERRGHSTWVDVGYLSEGLCASSRPHFFRGVATVVTKLFNIVEPDAAFFGKKDYQQYKVISRLVRDLDFDIDIVGVSIEREEDGLAMSSRNALLSPDMRAVAPIIYQSLCRAKERSRREGRISAETLTTAIGERVSKRKVVSLIISIW